MNDVSIFCLTLDPEHEKIIESLSYKPVGLGIKKFSTNCFGDKTGENISKKNPFYGEYTFHYWIWKNYLKNIETDWVGFCQYRKFFAIKETHDQNLSFSSFNEIIVKNIDKKYNSYDCILGNQFSVQNFKLSKIIKNHFKEFLLNPKLIFNKKKRTLKFHFDLFHGKGNLDKAIDQLDNEDKNKFREYMNKNTSFNPHNMFFCKTNILKKYYETIFPWLEKCEKIFGLKDSRNYGQKRIYGFLAERFLSYWFKKNYSVKELPIIGKNLSDYKNL
tara:strand:+ start:11709 stop:12530 length:822 start_codon:yes stop_codon:yes gene_type:complete